MEGKASNGNLDMAQYRASRGRATVIRATCEVLEKTGQKDDAAFRYAMCFY